MTSTADLFCEMVTEEPTIPHAAARFGAWLVGAAAKTGGFPIELTVHQITKGFERNEVMVQGMGGRYETIRGSVEWLASKGYLAVSEGKGVGFGYSARVFTITL
jgi:hypothetical protein